MYGSIVPLLPMRHAPIIFLLFLVSGPFVSVSASAQQSSQVYRGVAPEDQSYFRGPTFRCRDGSKTLGVDRLNDDFCDCVDGTDEPGTAACPGGKFYCRNRGHVPLSIFSSRVNDGICDCCDGSDEYLGKAKCENTCAEAGAENLQKLRAQVVTYGEGVKARLAYEEEAKSKRVEWSRDLEQLSAEEGILKKHVQRLQEQKEAVEKAEREEREWKERVEKEKEEADRKKREEEAAVKGGGTPGTAPEATPADSTVDEGGAESSPEDVDVAPESVPESEPITSPAEEDGGDRREAAEVGVPGERADPEEEDESKLSAEELGARIRARWTGSGGSSPPPVERDEHLRELEAEREMNTPDEDEPVPDYHDDHHDEDRDRVDEDHEDVHYDDHDDHLDDRDDDDNEPYMPPLERSETTETTSPSTTETSPAATTWWSRMIGSSSRLFRLFSSRPPSIDQSEASDIKQQYNEANDRFQKVQSDVKKLTKQLKLSYGKNDVLLKLYKQCFEVTQKQYLYKVCLFDKATQVEGHITTRLGEWQEVGKDHVDTLYFKKGERCWNGPERSMTVKLVCGVDNKLSSVDEPSRCEYAAVLATPVVCTESEAQALAKELEERESELKESKTGHDELR